jgi:predicted DNA binding CopG/RHH family protein
MPQIQLIRSLTSPSTLKEIISTTLAHPREILFENPLVNFAAIVATIGSLLFAAYAPSGVFVIFFLSLLIVCIGLVTEAQRYKIYTQKSLPIPIVINIANPANELDALNSLFSVIEQNPQFSNYQKNLQKYLNINQSDLVYKFAGDIFETKKLKDFLKITKHDLEKVKQKTPQNSIFYLAYIGPISVGILVGSMLAREGMIIFQRDQETNSYQGVLEVRDRLLKEKTTFEKFKLTEQRSDPFKKKVTVAIDTASHKIKIADPTIQNYGDIVLLENQNSNTILFQEDWQQYCREIFQILNQEQQQYEEIRLVYSMPVSLAIAMGMAIQHFWNIQLTNYDSQTGTYRDLMKINEIIYYF